MVRWCVALVGGALAVGCGGETDELEVGHSTLVDPPSDTLFPTTAGDDGQSTGSGSGGDTSSDGDVEPDPPGVVDPRAQVIYLVMTDRFVNGDPGNDLAGTPECFDPTAPRRFHGGDFAGVIEHLDDLQDLGVTTVWITPVQAQIGVRGESCGYHGYWADLAEPDDHAVEPKLGTADELRELSAALHDRGMRLVLDMVVNHAGYDARLTMSHPEWFHPGQGCGELGNPEITCPLASLPDFAHERDDVADYLREQGIWWIAEFDVDGVRMDTVKHVLPEFFAQTWLPAVQTTNPALFTVGEVLEEGSFDKLDVYLEAGFDSMFNFPLRRNLVEAFAKQGGVDQVAWRVQEMVDRYGIDRALLMTNLLDNHDVPRFTSELVGGDEVDRVARYRLALTTLFTVPGIPQLFYGNEIGMLGGGDPDNRADMPAWAFSAAGRSEPHEGFLGIPAEVFGHVRALTRIRAEHPSLWRGGYAELWQPNGGPSGVYAFYRSTTSDRAVVVVNAGAEAANVSLGLQSNPGIPEGDKARMPDGTAFVDVLGGSGRVSVDEGRLAFTIGGRQAAILVPDT